MPVLIGGFSTFWRWKKKAVGHRAAGAAANKLRVKGSSVASSAGYIILAKTGLREEQGVKSRSGFSVFKKTIITKNDGMQDDCLLHYWQTAMMETGERPPSQPVTLTSHICRTTFPKNLMKNLIWLRLVPCEPSPECKIWLDLWFIILVNILNINTLCTTSYIYINILLYYILYI